MSGGPWWCCCRRRCHHAMPDVKEDKGEGHGKMPPQSLLLSQLPPRAPPASGEGADSSGQQRPTVRCSAAPARRGNTSIHCSILACSH